MVEPYPSEKSEFVSWDDEIPNLWKVIKFTFQTTNQLGYDAGYFRATDFLDLFGLMGDLPKMMIHPVGFGGAQLQDEAMSMATTK